VQLLHRTAGDLTTAFLPCSILLLLLHCGLWLLPSALLLPMCLLLLLLRHTKTRLLPLTPRLLLPLPLLAPLPQLQRQPTAAPATQQ
jgi:hypothetical protein